MSVAEIDTSNKQASIVDALSNNNLELARDLLLKKVQLQVGQKASWDSPQYRGDKGVQRSIKLDYSRDKYITFFGLETLRDRYFLKDGKGVICEDIQMFFARVSAGIARGDKELAQSLYDLMSKNWFMPATPVLTNSATSRGAQISCFLNTVGDSISDIFKTYEENAFLAKGGGGIGTNWSEVRGHNSKLSSGGKSTGTVPFLKVMDSATLAVSQGNTRRGAAAVYMDISHPDIEEFIDIRKPTGGDDNRRCLNLHHGVTITDEFMRCVKAKIKFDLLCPHSGEVVKSVDATEMWRKILKNRVETGEPYILFIDTVNKTIPQHHKDKGLFVKQSNLCSEITLPTNRERTAVCCLGSLNLERWDEWKDEAESVLYAAVKALDNVLDNFIYGVDSRDYKRAIHSATQERSIGLGVMGWHGLLLKNRMPFESVQARSLNKIVFSTIHKYAKQASVNLADERGACPDGGNQRNSNVIAIAPTANISVICGGATPCVEPIAGNAYLQKTLSGSFLVKNLQLEQLLEEKGQNKPEIWRKIIEDKGSVRNIDFLTDEEKKIFKTGYELDMKELIIQAADRQKYICQSQSLNLFLKSPISGKQLNDVHVLAHELGVKSLYYLRSESVIEADSVDNTAVRRQVSVGEECSVCQ
ncbi:MAG: ribonucleoside-diphosphate reductase subunit alpha [Candidatus Melainabacteria bacterium]|jgi:ribonucleoside-diphosphate reductase alpha chain|nr:ribonucleoside-diphosphate reductase subunit alpha [Candidatus Melainabacteria bacterium]